MFDQRPSQALALARRIDGEIRNPSHPASRVEPRGNVADDRAGLRFLRDKHAIRLDAAIVRDGADLPPGPAAFAKDAELLLHVAVNRNRSEGLGGDLLQPRQVLWAVGADAIRG
jgi:hypothetical protein